MDDRIQKLESLLKDEETVNAIFTDSVEETQKNLAENGLDFTIDELMELAESFMPDEGELDLDALEGVAGGISIKTLLDVVRSSWGPILLPKFPKWKKK